MKSPRTILFSAAACLIFASAAQATTITASSSASAPVPGTYDQYNLGGVFSTDPSGQVTDHGPLHGQSFTTPAGGPFTLNTVSIKMGTLYTTPGGWQIRVSSLDGAGNLTSVAQTTLGLSVSPGNPADGDWLRFSFSGAPSLSSSTLYGFDVFTDTGAQSMQKTYGGNNYSGGGWIRTGSASRAFNAGYSVANINEDIIFNVGLSPVPEPSSLVLLGLGSVVLLARRRKLKHSV